MEQLLLGLYYISIALATGLFVSAVIFALITYIIYKLKFIDSED